MAQRRYQPVDHRVPMSLDFPSMQGKAVRCISEAYRVLKPGGIFKMALYHFWSLPHLWLLLSGIRNGNLKRLGYRRLLSTVEGGADGVSIAPLVKLYSSRVVRTILGD